MQCIIYICLPQSICFSASLLSLCLLLYHHTIKPTLHTRNKRWDQFLLVLCFVRKHDFKKKKANKMLWYVSLQQQWCNVYAHMMRQRKTNVQRERESVSRYKAQQWMNSLWFKGSLDNMAYIITLYIYTNIYITLIMDDFCFGIGTQQPNTSDTRIWYGYTYIYKLWENAFRKTKKPYTEF